MRKMLTNDKLFQCKGCPAPLGAAHFTGCSLDGIEDKQYVTAEQAVARGGRR